jgi:hypothetical protein
MLTLYDACVLSCLNIAKIEITAFLAISPEDNLNILWKFDLFFGFADLGETIDTVSVGCG